MKSDNITKFHFDQFLECFNKYDLGFKKLYHNFNDEIREYKIKGQNCIHEKCLKFKWFYGDNCYYNCLDETLNSRLKLISDYENTILKMLNQMY